VSRRIGGDEQRIHVLRVSFAAITYKHLLLPVWLLSYRYKETSFRVFVTPAAARWRASGPTAPGRSPSRFWLAALALGILVLTTQQ